MDKRASYPSNAIPKCLVLHQHFTAVARFPLQNRFLKKLLSLASWNRFFPPQKYISSHCLFCSQISSVSFIYFFKFDKSLEKPATPSHCAGMHDFLLLLWRYYFCVAEISRTKVEEEERHCYWEETVLSCSTEAHLKAFLKTQ